MLINDGAKTVLLYGDSFVWGVDPVKGGRFKPSERIGGYLQQVLGEGYDVVEAGLRGRVMFGENGWFPERNGLQQFGPIFASHLPLDYVVIMLGTNDLNTKTNHSPDEVAASLQEYQAKMKFWCDFMNYELPKVLIVAPPEIDEPSLIAFKYIFSGCSPQVEKLADALSVASNKLGYNFFDSREVIVSENTDGIHITADQNKNLARVLHTLLLD